ncbi:hypothetical protein AB434_3994 [Heyndrickxia coagulans]|uniref:Uncharacterized protein n=1 Tax=Heyndrickxia coagulans TaxID=1398 RepID=A0AAN0T6Q4_HEYCO|nr:hypothetical protein SB48_HM08orf01958 [Heyndrickxia coagulans]AKN56399.1 hypothetical protein AB434_3994 [Heyndrickxia coagulans]
MGAITGQFLGFRPHILSFIHPMKDSLAFMSRCFVFHQPCEGQFAVHGSEFCLSSALRRTIRRSPAWVLSFIGLMKDNLPFMDPCFVFHQPYEGQFAVYGPVLFCLSSAL